ncbi:MAG: hypothetical protein LC650_05195 [Actinobacteria bacterium]|nr:hypothetical protein [Actinomycetota bacterium]
MTISDDGATIAEALRQKTAIAVSDGSLKYSFGTAAFIIEGTNHNNNIRGVNQVPGPIHDGDSHRCEVSGLYSIVLIVKAIAQQHNVQQGHILIACDNETSLRIFDPDYKPDPQHKNFDLVNATWRIVKSSNIHWEPFHVYGHQENKRPLASLSRLERLNVAMDRTAKAFWAALCVHNNSILLPQPKSHAIHGEGWQLWHGDTKITQPSTNFLYSQIQDTTTQHWWVRHDVISQQAEDLNLPDWDATNDLLHHIPPPRRIWITKHSSHNCGVGTTLLRWNHQDHAKCPRCNKIEDTTHIYTCTGHNATEIWNQSILKLQQHLEKAETDPELATCLIDCLQQWRRKEKVNLSSYPDSLKQLVHEQRTLGWKNLLEGLPTRRWRIYQHNYYKQNNIRKSSTLWLRGTLQHINNLAWNQWNHRNKIKHNTVRPEEKRALKLLNNQIIREYTKGQDDLLPADRHHLRHNIVHLLQKPTDFKKAWLVNITTARQRKLRIQHNDNERITTSKATSRLIQWMKTNRLK